jgi:hypothetical protein
MKKRRWKQEWEAREVMATIQRLSLMKEVTGGG